MGVASKMAAYIHTLVQDAANDRLFVDHAIVDQMRVSAHFGASRLRDVHKKRLASVT